MTLRPKPYEYPTHSVCISLCVCESHYNKCKVMAMLGPTGRSSLAKRMHSFMNVALVTCSIGLAVTSFLHFFRRLCQPVVAVDCFMCGVWAPATVCSPFSFAPFNPFLVLLLLLQRKCHPTVAASTHVSFIFCAAVTV